jgi:hypothetical protein
VKAFILLPLGYVPSIRNAPHVAAPFQPEQGSPRRGFRAVHEFCHVGNARRLSGTKDGKLNVVEEALLMRLKLHVANIACGLIYDKCHELFANDSKGNAYGIRCILQSRNFRKVLHSALQEIPACLGYYRTLPSRMRTRLDRRHNLSFYKRQVARCSGAALEFPAGSPERRALLESAVASG